MTITLVALGVTVFSIISCARSQSGGSVGAVVNNDDPTIAYTPSVCSSGDISTCYGAWWDTPLDGGSFVKTTAGPSSAYKNVQNWLEFSFQGTKVELYGLMDAEGANMMIQLDSVISTINTSTGVGGASLQPTNMFNKEGLDPDVVHTLTVGWVGNGTNDTSGPSSYVYFDHLVVWNYHAVVSTSSGNSTDFSPSQTIFSAGPGQSSDSTTDSVGSASAKSSVKPGLFIGVTLACLVLLVVFIYGSIHFLRRRRRLRAPSARFRVLITSQMESHVDGPPSPALSMLKAEPHMSLPPAYWRESKEPEISTEDKEQKYRKGTSYLDLESGSMDEGQTIDSAVRKARNEAERSVKVAIPQLPHFKQSRQASPDTPFIPYTVRIGHIVVPQYTQATIVDGQSFSNRPSRDKQVQRVFPSASSEKRLLEVRGGVVDRNAASSSTHVSADGVLPLSSGMDYTLPPLSTSLDSQSAGSPDSLSVIASTSPRTISAPPPYTL